MNKAFTRQEINTSKIQLLNYNNVKCRNIVKPELVNIKPSETSPNPSQINCLYIGIQKKHQNEEALYMNLWFIHATGND